MATVPRTRTVPTGFGEPHSSKRSLRQKTANAKLEYHDNDEWQMPQTGVAAMRRYVYGEVVRRMTESNSVVTNVTIEALSWMLPDGNPELWECLLLLPMILSDTELQKMMKLERSTHTTPSPPLETSLYYIRSFELTPSELHALIDQLEEAGIRSGAGKIEAWKQAMELVPSGCNIFIRYVGMSQAMSAYARFAADLQSRNDGFYGTFMDALGKTAPHVITECKVWTVPSAATSAIRLPDGRLMPLVVEETDGRERALIELVGRSTLINQRTGGKFNSYQPSDKDTALFQKLQTSVFAKLERMRGDGQLQAPGPDTLAHVTGYALEVMKLGRKYPQELGTDKIKPNDMMEIAWAKQSTYASCYGGKVLFLLVGDYLPMSAMYNPAPYWEQKNARSVVYMKDSFQTLGARATQTDMGSVRHQHLCEIITSSNGGLSVHPQARCSHFGKLGHSSRILSNCQAAHRTFFRSAYFCCARNQLHRLLGRQAIHTHRRNSAYPLLHRPWQDFCCWHCLHENRERNTTRRLLHTNPMPSPGKYGLRRDSKPQPGHGHDTVASDPRPRRSLGHTACGV
jgi:hypothetical protein